MSPREPQLHVAASKIRPPSTRAVLFKHCINAALEQAAQQKIRPEERVTHQHIAALQRVEHGAQERLFITAFTPKPSNRRIEYCATVQAYQPQDSAQRKAKPWLLRPGFGIGSLIGRRVRQRHRRAIHQPQRTLAPRHGAKARAVINCPLCRTRVETSSSGKRWRAAQ